MVENQVPCDSRFLRPTLMKNNGYRDRQFNNEANFTYVLNGHFLASQGYLMVLYPKFASKKPG